MPTTIAKNKDFHSLGLILKQLENKQPNLRLKKVNLSSWSFYLVVYWFFSFFDSWAFSPISVHHSLLKYMPSFIYTTHLHCTSPRLNLLPTGCILRIPAFMSVRVMAFESCQLALPFLICWFVIRHQSNSVLAVGARHIAQQTVSREQSFKESKISLGYFKFLFVHLEVEWYDKWSDL